MDREVAKTLAELELKLRELERELTSLGRHTDAPRLAPEPPPSPSPFPSPSPAPTSASRLTTPPPSPSHPFSPPPSLSPSPPPGRLVDEAVEQPERQQPERRYSMEAQETAFGEIPATKDERDTIDLSELVMFKEKMQHTLQGLIDEYTRLLSLKPRR